MLRFGSMAGVVWITLLASAASAQRRPEAPPADVTGVVVVLGLVVIGGVALWLARGGKR